MNLLGKTVVITGAAQGIGQAISLTLAEAGANLALIDVNHDAIEKTAAQCEAFGIRARVYVADVSDEEQIDSTMEEIAANGGRLDGLVNNAGVIKDAMLIRVREGSIVGRMSLEQWRTVIDVNLTGVFLCGRAAAGQMIRLRQGGVIVNISSVSRIGNAGQTNYSAAKAGAATMATVWAKELGRYGIRAASIAPGFVRTDMVASMKPEALAKMTAPVPLQRLGEAQEIAAGVRFIFENDFMTGRCLELDGGLRL